MTLSAARHRALAEIDALPPDLRACVHEFGYPIVRACMKFGVKRPVHIRELVREIWLGPREDFQTGGAPGTLDWVLQKAGARISAATLFRVLCDNNIAVIPASPTRAMIAASMAEVTFASGPLDKTEKHRRRLAAAIRTGMRDYPPCPA